MQVFDGCPNITVDGSFLKTQYGGLLGVLFALGYETTVLHLLKTINGTRTGSDLFAQIDMRGFIFNKKLVIQPYTPDDVTQTGAINAYAEVEPGEDFHAATPLGVPVLSGQDDKKTPQDDRFDSFGKGTGGGTDARIHFSPDTPFSTLGTVVTDPDEVLFHEMNHALRDMQGTETSVPTGRQDRNYDNIEEFFAILMSNIYASEKYSHPVLRKDHHGHKALPDEESDSEGFLLNNDENLFWIKYLYPQEMVYFQAVAANPMAGFNPLREYITYQNFYDALTEDIPTGTYTVQAGDSLSLIAQNLYGDMNKWRIIYSMNRRVIGSNPNLIRTGQKLTVPVLA